MEAITELVLVNLENSPVFCEVMFTDTETDSWGAEDVAKDMVVEFFLVIVDPIEQCSKCLHCILGLVQQPLSLNPGLLCLLSIDSVGTLLPVCYSPPHIPESPEILTRISRLQVE